MKLRRLILYLERAGSAAGCFAGAGAAAGRESKKLCCTIYRPTDLIHVLHLILTHPPLNEELFTTCRRGLFQRQQVKCFALVAVNLCKTNHSAHCETSRASEVKRLKPYTKRTFHSLPLALNVYLVYL
jgi:hypothetical protein